jgi:hypothetical protein
MKDSIKKLSCFTNYRLTIAAQENLIYAQNWVKPEVCETNLKTKKRKNRD